MKQIILVAIFALGTLQAGDIVHYDKKTIKPTQTSKPNHPSVDLYTGK